MRTTTTRPPGAIENRDWDAALRIVTEGTSSSVGEEFFAALVRHLAGALDVRYALVTELIADEEPTRLGTLAVWNGTGPGPSFEYEVEGTPCEVALEEGSAFFPDRLQERFPQDTGLVSWGAESYFGVALRDRSGELIGELCIFDDEPLRDRERCQFVVGAFAARAVAEIERRHEDGALRDHLSRLRALIDSLRMGVIVEDVEQRILRVNRFFGEMFGIEDTEGLVGINCRDAAHAAKGLFADPDGFIEGLDDLLEDQAISVGRELRLADGRVLEQDYVPVHEDGAEHGHVWLYRDVTERRRADAVTAAENRALDALANGEPLDDVLRLILHSIETQHPEMAAAIFVLEPLTDSIRLASSFGLSESSASELGPQSDSGSSDSCLAKPARPEGFAGCRARPIPAPDGVVVGTLTVYQRPGEIEDPACRPWIDFAIRVAGLAIGRHRTLAALRDSEERYRGLVEDLDAIVWEVDAETLEATFVSERAESMLGYPVSRWLEERHFWYRIVHPEDRDCTREKCRRAAAAGEDHELDYRVVDSKGRVVWIHDTVSVCRDEHGRPIKLRGVMVDVSAIRSAEVERLRAQKLESVGVLAGGIAHDFNNLLTGILGNLSLARASMRCEDEAFTWVADAERATQRAQGLSRQLLAFSKGGDPIKKPASAAELVRESAVFALRGSNVRCEDRLPDDLPPVEVDAGQIQQVFQNLVINARDAMPGGGVVTLRADRVRVPGRLAVEGLESGDYVRIRVDDHGVGITAENLPRIFDPYFTTKEGGSGLGLAASYMAMRGHGGHIVVESAPGRGSSFRVLLPVADGSLPLPADREVEIAPGQGRILVLEDDRVIRELLVRMLARLGYTSTVAAEGQQAIEAWETARRAGQSYAALLVDLTVPAGMGGHEVVEHVQAIDPDVRAIVSSGYSNDPIMADFRAHGFRGVLEKPYTLEALARVLRDVLDS